MFTSPVVVILTAKECGLHSRADESLGAQVQFRAFEEVDIEKPQRNNEINDD